VAVKNIIMASNGLSLSLIGEPRRMADYAAETWFFYRTFTDRRGVSQRTVFDALGTRQSQDALADIKLAWVPPYAGQWFQPIASYTVDLVALCSICALTKPKVVFEIGTLTGYTALHFALNTPAETEIYSLDLPSAADGGPALKTTLMDDNHIQLHRGIQRYAFDGYPQASKIHTLFGDSARFDYGPFEKQVDLFFIDGAHSYEYVRQDTLNAFRACHEGSLIVWHDYGRTGVNGVSKWIHELSRTREIYSVPGGSIAFTVVAR
jgi:Methyltransferase domain